MAGVWYTNTQRKTGESETASGEKGQETQVRRDKALLETRGRALTEYNHSNASLLPAKCHRGKGDIVG